ncbi:hypothetical protein ACQP2Y_35495 [Actinoplanes sp. CA-051413]|uniref:hypothetical protein n=1 Tax=Actinoplanes sp. CA-051413 TaxID=3239899 RepID=UPI003D9786C4
MPRLPRFLAAGLLLFAATLVLSALLASGPRGLIAAGVFVPLWYVIAVLNAWLGVVWAGYPVRAEIAVFGLVFGVPAVVAVVVGSLYSPEVGGGRIWFLWAAGVRSAGYSVAEELPILLANAALPFAVAVVAWRVLARRRPAAS